MKLINIKVLLIYSHIKLVFVLTLLKSCNWQIKFSQKFLKICKFYEKKKQNIKNLKFNVFYRFNYYK